MDAIAASKTQRLYLLLRDQISSGTLQAGARLPGEPTLARDHSLSRVTVRRALDALSRDGLVRREPGSGTYVRLGRESPQLTGDLTNLLAGLIAMGEATEVQLLSFGYLPAPAALSAALLLPEGTEMQRAVRVRRVNGTPLSHLTTHVPAAIGRKFGEADLARTPLLLLLERAGVKAETAEQTISATLAGPDMAEALAVDIGSPLLSLTRVVFDANGEGIEHLSALYRPDMYRFHLHLSRDEDSPHRHWRPTHTTIQKPKSGRREQAARRRTQ